MTAVKRQVSGFIVFTVGFRPFYLAALVLAVIILPLWIAIFFGLLPWGGHLDPVSWHSHEMIFGFAVAVIAGFLLTAVRNWTGLPTLSRGPLAALVTLWVLARILLLTGPTILAVCIDMLFLPTLVLVISKPIVLSRNTRNLKVIFVLGGLAFANMGFHLSQIGFLPPEFARISILVAIDIIAILMAVIAGRIIPAFISNAVTNANPKQVIGIEFLAFASLILILGFELAAFWYPVPGVLWFIVLLIGFISHAVRLILWHPFKTRHQPLLWMLPVAYAWIPLALLLRALAMPPLEILAPSYTFHAMTIGAMTSLMVTMMMRSALGHTGRELEADRLKIGAFLLLQTAAILRILPGFIWPQNFQYFLLGSAMFWFLAFVGLLVCLGPILIRPRIDGKPG
ncbi:MAG: NnrS family protein [Pseudomonadales bacterium]|nr:NnrS family protein [Pseudomonadales bacterium]